MVMSNDKFAHLVSILLGESDGTEFEVLLHEILMGKEVQGSLLMMFDGFLWQHTKVKGHQMCCLHGFNLPLHPF